MGCKEKAKEVVEIEEHDTLDCSSVSRATLLGAYTAVNQENETDSLTTDFGTMKNYT